MAVSRGSGDHAVGQSDRTLTADRGDVGIRIDVVIRRHLADLNKASRTRIQQWITHGRVRINGATVNRVATRAAFGDTIAVALPASAIPMAMHPEELPLEVLYEDDDVMAVNKPAGMVVHPTYRHASGTLMNGLLWRASSWPSPQRPSIVGRLDKDTSGVVVIAKHASAHAALQRVLASRRAEKHYLALVHGWVNKDRGVIDAPLSRDARDRRRVVTVDRGLESLTEFETLARTNGAGANAASLLRCRLVTGRMHQIRVHLASSGWPIVGDRKYGAASHGIAVPRQALHAWVVRFDHPATGRPLVLRAPLPEDLKGVLVALGLRRDY